jgi:hypothetical protein
VGEFQNIKPQKTVYVGWAVEFHQLYNTWSYHKR